MLSPSPLPQERTPVVDGALARWRLLRSWRTIAVIPVVVSREEQKVAANDDERVLITADGFEQLRRELDRLQTHERRRLSALLREARADGALDDNPALIDLLDEQTQLERRIALLEAQLAVAEIAPPARDGRVAIGSVVRIRDLQTGEVFEYEVVGSIEGDATNGRISTAAPVGRALIGQRGGAEVEVAAPRGRVMLKVLNVVADSTARSAA
jgi:transcription elongation factor GreA